jgi:hypothetical protein
MLLDRCALGTSRMTHGRHWLAMVMVIGLVASLSQPLHADELQKYAEQCTAAMDGVAVPAFQCSAGTVVPVTHASSDGKTCDRPDRLNKKCDAGSTFQVLKRSETAIIVALCRSEGNKGSYPDVAVIQYNPKNGATCFYQKLARGFPGDVTAPSAGVGEDGFQPPSETVSNRCVNCHDNGPFIRSPYLTQIKGVNALPGAGDNSFNKGQPYAFVGKDLVSWSAYSVEVKGNSCLSCHRLGVAKGIEMYGKNKGTAIDFGIRATAKSETSKNPTSADSPPWMPPILGNRPYDPTKDGFDQRNADAAAEIRACALHVSDQSLPDTDKCRIAPFAKAFTGQ